MSNYLSRAELEEISEGLISVYKAEKLSGTRRCSARNKITLNNNLDSMGDVLF